VRENDDPVGGGWDPKIPLQLDIPRTDANQPILEGGCQS
jgi:hypothetical protein